MLKRTTAVLAIGAVSALSMAASSPAGAADPKLSSYGAGSYATALEVGLLGQDLAVSTTSAAINSNPQAKADGAALLLAGNPIPGAAPAAAPGGPATNHVCAANINLKDLTGGAIDLANVDLACVDTSAKNVDGFPSASSATGELVIRVVAPAGDVLAPILAPVLDAVQQVTDPLLLALQPITGIIQDATQIDVPAILDQVLDTVDARNLNVVVAEIAVAPSGSVAEASDAAGVLAQAGANGATIRVLPGIAQTLLDLGLNVTGSQASLATIKLGTANAKVVRDPITGKADVDSSAAQLLSIKTADTLGILQDLTGAVTDVLDALSINVLGCDAGNPLADILCIELGHVNDLDHAELVARNLDFGDGTVGREASAATVRVLPILADSLGGDAVTLRLGTATAAANATPFVAPPPTVAPVRKMPKTGGTDLAPFAFVLLAAAGATGALVRRSRTV
jgi:hypothetical protein